MKRNQHNTSLIKQVHFKFMQTQFQFHFPHRFWLFRESASVLYSLTPTVSRLDCQVTRTRLEALSSLFFPMQYFPLAIGLIYQTQKFSTGSLKYSQFLKGSVHYAAIIGTLDYLQTGFMKKPTLLMGCLGYIFVIKCSENFYLKKEQAHIWHIFHSADQFCLF